MARIPWNKGAALKGQAIKIAGSLWMRGKSKYAN